MSCFFRSHVVGFQKSTTTVVESARAVQRGCITICSSHRKVQEDIHKGLSYCTLLRARCLASRTNCLVRHTADTAADSHASRRTVVIIFLDLMTFILLLYTVASQTESATHDDIARFAQFLIRKRPGSFTHRLPSRVRCLVCFK